ncbi:MAG: polyphosphate kinase 2 family protein [Limisphaerales bacterium]
MKRKDLAGRYRIADDKKFRLKDIDPADTWKLKSSDQARQWLEEGVSRLSELQDLLYAQNKSAVLLILQAMDAAGKDGIIKHVMSGVNPQGCQVYAFKAPSQQELNHDFLWRTTKCLPERGHIGIFNRSYYEEVLVVRVHPELLAHENLAPPLVTSDLWNERFQDINTFERHLVRNGVVVRKFFLHVSKKEQRQRLLARLDQADKNWKISMADVQERHYWDDYADAYQDMIRHTATEEAPWYVVPADNKWFTRLIVAEVVVDALESLHLKYPELSDAQHKELGVIRKTLLRNG